ncbi:MAG: hypothetical protein M3N46_11175, partial [Actinomycetota bacterium]|nr:hypothetical protein [Actinomycetota bacterium]
MVFAQQHSVGHIGATVVSRPVFDVMRFAPGRWSLAVGPQASAVAFSQRDALSRGEQSLLPTDVEGVS